MYQEIHPTSVIDIDSVRINTSLMMMRECQIFARIGAHGEDDAGAEARVCLCLLGCTQRTQRD